MFLLLLLINSLIVLLISFFQGDLGLCDPIDATLCPQNMENGGHQVVVGVCAMAKKSQSKPMKEILTRLQEFEYIKVIVFSEEIILQVI